MFINIFIVTNNMRIILIILLTVLLSVTAIGQQNLKKGSSAPVFTAAALDGTSYDLSRLRGKIVVLTFWSSRCEICRVEIPKLNRLVERFKNSEVVFLGLTMESTSKVQAFLQNNPFDFHILPNSFGVLLQYADKDREGNINMGFPAHYLVNKSGEIELITGGFDKTEILHAEINRLLTSK